MPSNNSETGDGNETGKRTVTRASPCPVCGGDHKCAVCDDGLILCGRQAGPVPGFRSLGPAKRDSQFHLFRRTEAPPARLPRPPASAVTDWRVRAEALRKDFTADRRQGLAVALGLPAAAFDGLPLTGFDVRTSSWVFPECGGTGEIIGLSRRGSNGRKGFFRGGRRGVTVPADWQTHAGPAYLVEGPSDAIALTFAGLSALGRPSNVGGVDILASLLRDWPHDRPIVVVGENDARCGRDGLTTCPGRDGAERTAKELARRLGRIVHYAMTPDGAKDPRAWLTAPDRQALDWTKRGWELASRFEPVAVHAADGRPVIVLGADQHRVTDEACAALGRVDGVYQRGGSLVDVVAHAPPSGEAYTFTGSPSIREMPAAQVRDRLSFAASWHVNRNGRSKPTVVPYWCVAGVQARGTWDAIPHLQGVVDYPVLLPNGRVLDTPGLHRPTGLLYRPSGPLDLAVPGRPTRDDAQRAVAALAEAVQDFPFETPVHRATWLAGLLTPLAWFAFDGPAPLFLLDANVRGCGKGLLTDVIAVIVTGRRLPVTTYTHDGDELRKWITTAAIRGERMVVFDNVTGKFGNAELDAALTGKTWRSRVLGGNTAYEGPLNATWFATGNNVQLCSDTPRRVAHIRLRSPEESPERRLDFRYPDLRAWAAENRGRLLTAALTVLRAWVEAGRPRHNLTPWGSFEGWSAVVREAVVFAGWPDPGESREGVQLADPAAAAMKAVMDGMTALDPRGGGLTAAEIVARVQNAPPEEFGDFRQALEDLCGEVNSRVLGYKLREYKDYRTKLLAGLS